MVWDMAVSVLVSDLMCDKEANDRVKAYLQQCEIAADFSTCPPSIVRFFDTPIVVLEGGQRLFGVEEIEKYFRGNGGQ